MKTCPLCGASLDDGDLFCTACGAKLAQPEAPQPEAPAPAPEAQQPADEAQPQPEPQPAPEPPQQPVYTPPYTGAAQPPYTPQPDPFDHTAEFDAKDISDNKVYIMLMYLFGFFGVIVALLMHTDSPYLTFHLRQWMKITVTVALMWVVASVLSVFVLPLIAALLMTPVFGVIQIIMFVQVCQGKAKEPAIVRNLNFLK